MLGERISVFTGVLFVLGGTLLIGTAYALCNYDALVQAFIERQLVLEANHKFFELWRDPPLNFIARVYLFNITNVEEFPWLSTKPKLTQLGPYVYKEYWHRKNFQWYPNNTLSYKKLRTFIFDEESSMGSLNDVVVNFNIPLLAIASRLKNVNSFVRMMAAPILQLMSESTFIKRTVKEMLFDGYKDPLMQLGKDIINLSPFSEFGYMIGRNLSEEERFTVYSGRGKNLPKAGITQRFNEKDDLGIWDGDSCNKIHGTDGSSFPPITDPTQDVQIFHPFFCRFFNLSFERESQLLGVSVRRYNLGKKNFDNGSLIPENKCYCAGDHCLKSGTMYLGPCYYDLPLYASKPHFYEADVSYLEAIEGLEPHENLHSSYVNIEPLSGVPLNVTAKVQLNAYIERIPDLGLFDRMPTMLFPLMWSEEGGAVPEPLVAEFQKYLYIPLYYAIAVLYVLLGIGIVAVLLPTALFLKDAIRHRCKQYTPLQVTIGPNYRLSTALDVPTRLENSS